MCAIFISDANEIKVVEIYPKNNKIECAFAKQLGKNFRKKKNFGQF